ncbi:DNA-packaging protein [Tropicibacter sp. Alg240-R139]|uniref:DNA-packaging protein n=1 Tax=Tropicibacter sp. Alg240-R139 TaxID=2305991 RepID=UPI0013E0C8B0|nr:terminase family protein [Tropicibacter sp. Alg240-R139]
MRSTLTELGLRSGAGWLASAPAATRETFLSEIGEGGLCALPFLFEFWALPHQLPPEGDWRSWVIMGGRGAGKTRAGAEWVRSITEGSKPLDEGRCKRIALIGETFDQLRDVMIFGDSGILQCSPPDRRPVWKASERKLTWPNGAEAQAFSAHDPEGLRGPQFDGAWVDELAKWKKAGETWDMLQFALRLGDRPQVCVTTTPRNVGVLKQLLESPSTVTTRAPTEANRANLAASFLEEVRARYAGTRLGRQELDGVLLQDAEGALWSSEQLERARKSEPPALDRVVVAIDPSVTSGARADECGIVVAGVQMKGPPQDWRGYVLADRTVRGKGPSGWAAAAIAAMDEFGAERLVAEVNQGGQLVEEVVRQIDPLVPYKGVHASRGKVARAEPVAALYEQDKVRHVGDLSELEEQMCQMTAHGFEGQGSPDRVDALVWAMHELMIAPASQFRRPRVRVL